MNMDFKRKLPVPKDVKAEFPLDEKMIQVKAARDEEIKAVFNGTSDKFILVIGPCSADHSEPVLEYISRLRRVADQVSDKIVIIPRIYTNSLVLPATVIRACCTSPIPMPSRICTRVWLRSGSCI